MSDHWLQDGLQEELGRHLTPVVAPEELRVRLGFAPAPRRAFPRILLAVAAAVVMMAGGLAANREARNGEAVEFVAANSGAVSVWLGHEAGAGGERRATHPSDAGCNVCHNL